MWLNSERVHILSDSLLRVFTLRIGSFIIIHFNKFSLREYFYIHSKEYFTCIYTCLLPVFQYRQTSSTRSNMPAKKVINVYHHASSSSSSLHRPFTSFPIFLWTEHQKNIQEKTTEKYPWMSVYFTCYVCKNKGYIKKWKLCVCCAWDDDALKLPPH